MECFPENCQKRRSKQAMNQSISRRINQSTRQSETPNFAPRSVLPPGESLEVTSFSRHLFWLLCANTMLQTNLELSNVSQCHQRITKAQPRIICKENSVMFGNLFPKICMQYSTTDICESAPDRCIVVNNFIKY